MDRDLNGRKYNTKENINKTKSNKEKIMTSKFFTPLPAIPNIQLPGKKPVLSKSLRKSREMYRNRIVSSQEVSRKKIKLDKEKAKIFSRADVAADKATESDDEFFEKIRQKYENDKAQGLLIGGSQQKTVKKVNKLFSDECVKLMNKFKEACKNPSPTNDDDTIIIHSNSTENSKINETPIDNFSTQNNYPSNINNNNTYQNYPRSPQPRSFLSQTPSFSLFSNNQAPLSDTVRDDLMSDFPDNSDRLSLHNQLLSSSSLKRSMSKMRMPSNLSKFSNPQFPADDGDNEFICPTPPCLPSPPNSNSNNNNCINYSESFTLNSNKIHLPDYLFKK